MLIRKPNKNTIMTNKEKPEEYEYFVARVRRYGGGWRVRVDRFSDAHVWDADYRSRAVVPQLSALELESIPIDDPETPSTFENRIESLEADMKKIRGMWLLNKDDLSLQTLETEDI